MESSPDRENSQGTTESRVADDKVHKHGTQEVSSAEDAAAAASSVRGALGRMSAPERLEGDVCLQLDPAAAAARDLPRAQGDVQAVGRYAHVSV